MFAFAGGYYGNKGNVDNPSTQEEEDVNFFEDMTPKIKKQQKVRKFFM